MITRNLGILCLKSDAMGSLFHSIIHYHPYLTILKLAIMIIINSHYAKVTNDWYIFADNIDQTEISVLSQNLMVLRAVTAMCCAHCEEKPLICGSYMLYSKQTFSKLYLNVLKQDSGNSKTNALELLLSCTKPITLCFLLHPAPLYASSSFVCLPVVYLPPPPRMPPSASSCLPWPPMLPTSCTKVLYPHWGSTDGQDWTWDEPREAAYHSCPRRAAFDSSCMRTLRGGAVGSPPQSPPRAWPRWSVGGYLGRPLA